VRGKRGGEGLRVRLTRATAVDGGADLSDDGEEADPDAGNLEGVGDRQVRVPRLPGRRLEQPLPYLAHPRVALARISLARPLTPPR